MIPLGGPPAGDVVAGDAVHGGGDVRIGLAGGRTTVVAGGAHGGSGKEAVIGLGADPAGSGLVATLASSLAVMNGGGGTAGQAIDPRHMTSRALGAHRHAGMELP